MTYMLQSGTDHILKPFIGSNTRNFGYPMFTSIFLINKHQEVSKILHEAWSNFPRGGVEFYKYIYNQFESRLPGVISGIIYTQLAGYFIAFILLYYSIWKVLGGNNGLLIILTSGILLSTILNFYPLYNARVIGTESLAIVCCSLFISFLLLYKRYNKILFLSISFFFASYAFFLRPNMICLVALASLYLVYLIFINKTFKKFIIPFICILLAYSYVIELSIISGHICFGAMDSLTNLMFYSYYAEDDDLDQMQNNLAKDYHKIFIETKSDHPVITGAGYKSALKNRNYVFVADSLIFSHPSVIDITNDKFRKMHPEYDLNYLNLS